MAILLWVVCLAHFLRVSAVNASNGASILLNVRDELQKIRPEHSPLVCVVVRTYWKHGSAYSGGLRYLIGSLIAQTHERSGV
jgi:hypothetical protein